MFTLIKYKKIITIIIASLGIVLLFTVTNSLLGRSIEVANPKATISKTPDKNGYYNLPVVTNLVLPAYESSRFDLLILGIRGEGHPEEGGLLTDTMQLISVDRVTGRASVTSIPRDLYVNMDGVSGKLNSVYEQGLVKGKGLKTTAEVISKITGVRVDKVLLFDFDAFKEIVDAFGGLDVHLDQPFREPSQWGYVFELPAGDNHLNGEQALYYARSRYSSSDFDRARRQQQLIQAFRKKALSLNILGNPQLIIDLYTKLKANIKTDLGLLDSDDLLRIASIFSQNSKPRSIVLSTDNYLNETHSARGEYLLIPKTGDYEEIHKAVQGSLKDLPKPSPSKTFSPSPSGSSKNKK